MAGLAITLKISTVTPDDSGVHVDDALRDQVAHQCSLIGIARRQTDNLRVRWVGIEIFVCFKWIVNDTQRVQLPGYLTYGCTDIQFRKPSVWPQAQAAQSSHFFQLMGLSRLECIEPIDGQTSFVRSGGSQTEVRTVWSPILLDHARLDVTDDLVARRQIFPLHA